MYANGTLLGIFNDIPSSVYHHPECPGASNSFLKEFGKSPAHGLLYLTNKERKSTPAQILGIATHMAVYEPEAFKGYYTAIPEGCTKSSTVGKNWYAEMEARGVKNFMKAEDFKTVELIEQALRQHSHAAPLLFQNQGQVEHCVFWYDKDTGIFCKARPDQIRPDHIGVDLKTTVSADEEGYFDFPMTAYNNGYHIQGAYYMDGIAAATGVYLERFCLVAVEKKPPFGIRIYVLGKDEIELGRQTYKRNLRRLLKTTQTNDWSCYPPEPTELKFPAWTFTKGLEE